MKKIVMASALLLSTGLVQAEEAEARLLLGGALSIDSSNFAEELDDDLAAFGLEADDDSGLAIGLDLHAGLSFMEASSIRLGYRKFGQQSAEVTQPGFLGSVTAELDADGLYAAADLLFPVNDSFYLGGTIGMQAWDIDLDVEGFSESEDGSDLFYGLIGKVLFNDKSGAVTMSVNRYSFDLDGSDLEYTPISVGVEIFL
ncbi:porin family protein [Alcanivorax sp. S6407]|uniref:outer membrane beta-barrel protein n=1 Tax=Alcanivorax sp. S6407 TaxID=2926424 RepID=UPI001FF2DE82|nr:outer membrane beta-barrel protein [Alcanivorax sp. S6407]MCK0154666.1 porin family protein [Alcanivorax sp. S6407]